jgi:hypothetical protein
MASTRRHWHISTLKLHEGIYRFVACEVEHPGTAGPDGFDFSPVFLDPAVASDDEPPLARSLGDPDLVVSAGVRNRALRSDPAALDWPSRISWIGHIRPDLREYLCEPQYVSVDVVVDDGRLRRLRHAAVRADVS